MKLLSLLSILMLLFMGCENENSPVNPTVPNYSDDTVEVTYLPISMTGNIKVTLLKIDTSIIDTVITDTNQLIGLTGDSLFLYTHDNEKTVREASLRANPEWDVFTLEPADIEPYVAQLGLGYSVKSIKQRSSNSTVSVTGSLLTLASNKVLALELEGGIIPISEPVDVNVNITTLANLFDGICPPENWPALQIK